MRLADAVSYASTAPIRLDKKDNVVHLDATINGVHNYKGLRAHLAPVMCSATRAVGGGVRRARRNCTANVENYLLLKVRYTYRTKQTFVMPDKSGLLNTKYFFGYWRLDIGVSS